MSDQAASAPQSTDVSTIPQPRPLGAVNWLGLWTLYKKEVRRFLKVSFQFWAMYQRFRYGP